LIGPAEESSGLRAVFAHRTFWPDGHVAGAPDRVASNRTCRKPKAGSVLMLWDGENYVLWTGMTDPQLLTVSRFATGLLRAGREA
jgi:hypothetical protein